MSSSRSGSTILLATASSWYSSFSSSKSSLMTFAPCRISFGRFPIKRTLPIMEAGLGRTLVSAFGFASRPFEPNTFSMISENVLWTSNEQWFSMLRMTGYELGCSKRKDRMIFRTLATSRHGSSGDWGSNRAITGRSSVPSNISISIHLTPR